jgi:wobble nucleotide-excising tRNase
VTDHSRDIGHMEAEIKNLTKAVDDLSAKVETINTTLAEAKGGWRTLMWVSGTAGTIGSALTYLLQHLHRS